jgi:hypothetical protein
VKVIRILRLLAIILILFTTLTPAAQAYPTSGNRQTPTVNLVTDVDEIEIRADSFGLPSSDHEIASLYEKPSVFLQQGDGIKVTVFIPQDGNYTIAFDMAATASYINPPEAQLLIDGAFPLVDAQRIIFPIYYRNTRDTFPLDRYGNDALIRQERLLRWQKVILRDINFSQKYPTQVFLIRGQHTLEFSVTQESMLLGSIYLAPFAEYLTYSQYLAENQAPDSSGVSIEFEAEFPTYKNDTSIRPVNSRSLDVTPYDTYKLLLNTMGGDSWKKSGSSVFYEIDVPEDGMYCITLRALQNFKNNFTVFRKITINGEVMYDELTQIEFFSSSKWTNFTLGGDSPYKVFLKKGKNVLGIEANDAPYHSAIEKIKKVLIDINVLALEIKKLTGNQSDIYKEWVISDYIPDIKEQLLAIAEDLQQDLGVLKAINKEGGSQEILSYQMAIDNILSLAQDPDKIPSRMNRFSEGSGSAAQLLASVLPLLQGQPLALDKIYIHSPDSIPEQVKVLVITSLIDGAKRFIYSFRPNPYQSIGAEAGEIEVWVNRPRQYVDLLQTMTDEIFTPKTGIRIKLASNQM